MIDKLGLQLQKLLLQSLKLLVTLIQRKKVIGVVFRDKFIPAEISLKKKQYRVDNFSNQQIAGIGEDQDFLSATTYLSDQVKNALDSLRQKRKM